MVMARFFLDSLRRGLLSQETVLEAKRDARVRGGGGEKMADSSKFGN